MQVTSLTLLSEATANVSSQPNNLFQRLHTYRTNIACNQNELIEKPCTLM
jgi:hypothetical protein